MEKPNPWDHGRSYGSPLRTGNFLQSWKFAEFPPGEGEARMGHTTVSMLNGFCDKGLLQDGFVMKNLDPGHVQLLIDHTNYIYRQELQHREMP